MARLQRKLLSNPDEVRTFANGRVEIFSLDDVDVGLQVFAPGWRRRARGAHRTGSDLGLAPP